MAEYVGLETQTFAGATRKDTAGWLALDWVRWGRSKLRGFSDEIRLKRDVARQRAQLRQLEDSQLRDIGVSRAQAKVEGRRGHDDLPLEQMRRRRRQAGGSLV